MVIDLFSRELRDPEKILYCAQLSFEDGDSQGMVEFEWERKLSSISNKRSLSIEGFVWYCVRGAWR